MMITKSKGMWTVVVRAATGEKVRLRVAAASRIGAERAARAMQPGKVTAVASDASWTIDGEVVMRDFDALPELPDPYAQSLES